MRRWSSRSRQRSAYTSSARCLHWIHGICGLSVYADAGVHRALIGFPSRSSFQVHLLPAVHALLAYLDQRSANICIQQPSCVVTSGRLAEVRLYRLTLPPNLHTLVARRCPTHAVHSTTCPPNIEDDFTWCALLCHSLSGRWSPPLITSAHYYTLLLLLKCPLNPGMPTYAHTHVMRTQGNQGNRQRGRFGNGAEVQRRDVRSRAANGPGRH